MTRLSAFVVRLMVHPERISSSDHDAVTPMLAGLALADRLSEGGPQTASDHLELMCNGDHVSLNSSIRGWKLYLVGE